MSQAVTPIKPEIPIESVTEGSEKNPESRLEKVEKKAKMNEFRARDAEARCRIIEAELKILRLRNELEQESHMDSDSE